MQIPNVKEVIDPLLDIKTTFEGETSTIQELRDFYFNELNRCRNLSKTEIFNIFASALLERAMMGELYTKRIRLMNERWKSYGDITEESIRGLLTETGYRFPKAGLNVILKLKKLTENNFAWEDYFNEAEKNYENNFSKDPFLNIKYVAYKVRDFALSEFSRYYLANDIHIIRMIKRTGLLINGYGDINIGTNPSDENEYLFLKRLIVRLSKESGWEKGEGYSPGEIDKIFWHFGRNICKADPLCNQCPLKNVCLTGSNRK
ncbi:hypothetical protein ACFL96_04055 [Thermoproteota archaeon]